MPLIETNKVSYRTLVLEVVLESQSVANNTSQIYYKLRGGSGGGDTAHWVNTGPCECTVGGTKNSRADRVAMYDGTTMLEGRVTVTHDAAGNYTLAYSCAGTIYNTGAYNASASGSYALPNIPRYTNLTSQSAAVVYNKVTVSWAASDICSEIRIHTGNVIGGGTTLAQETGQSKSSGSLSWAANENTKYDYYITLKRKDSGLAKLFGPYSATTPYRAPVINVSFVSSTLNSLTYSWTSDMAISKCNHNNGSTLLGSTTYANLTSGTATVTGLSPGTTYSISLPMWRSDGVGAFWPAAVNGTTKAMSKFLSAPAFNDEGNPVVTYDCPSGGDASTLSVGIYKTDNSTVLAAYRACNKTGTLSYTFNLTQTERDTLLTQCMSAQSMTVRYFLYATINGVGHTAFAEATFSVVNDKPTFITTPATLLANFNDGAASKESYNTLLGDPSIPTVVQGLGKLRAQIAANCGNVVKKSTPTKLIHRITNAAGTVVQEPTEINYNAVANNIDYILSSPPGSYNLRLQLKNSRGTLSDEKVIPFDIVAYAVPTIIASMARNLGYEEKVSLSMSAISYKMTVAGTRRNTVLALEYRYAAVGNSMPSSWTAITDSTATQNANDSETLIRNIAASDGVPNVLLASNTSYNFEVQVRDAVGYQNGVAKFVVPAGIPLFSIFENGVVAIGKVPGMTSGDALVQVGGDIEFNDGTGATKISKLKSDLLNRMVSGTIIAEGVDLNTITTAGVYRLAGTHGNNPGLGYSQLLVCRAATDTIWQMGINYSTAALFYRAGNPSNIGGTGVWSTWRQAAQLDTPTFIGTPNAPTAASSVNNTQIATTAYVKGQALIASDANSALRQGGAFGTAQSGKSLAYVYGMATGWGDTGHFPIADVRNSVNLWENSVESDAGNCRIRIGRYMIVIQSTTASITYPGTANWATNGTISPVTYGGGGFGFNFVARPLCHILGESPNADHILIQTAATVSAWPTWRVGQHGVGGTVTVRMNLLAIGRVA